MEKRNIKPGHFYRLENSRIIYDKDGEGISFEENKDYGLISVDFVEDDVYLDNGVHIGITEFVTLFKEVDDTKSKDKELVNHPQHYGGDTTYECIKVLKAWLSPDEYKGFLKGNAIRYLCRAGNKDAMLQEFSIN